MNFDETGKWDFDEVDFYGDAYFSEDKCLSAIEATKRENGHADNVDYIVANLSSMKEV